MNVLMTLTPGEIVGLVVGIGTIIGWFIRLEHRITTGERADSAMEDKHSSLKDDMNRYYATKTELTEVRGSLTALVQTVQRSEQTLGRIENKVDSFLVAAVKHGATVEIGGGGRNS